MSNESKPRSGGSFREFGLVAAGLAVALLVVAMWPRTGEGPTAATAVSAATEAKLADAKLKPQPALMQPAKLEAAGTEAKPEPLPMSLPAPSALPSSAAKPQALVQAQAQPPAAPAQAPAAPAAPPATDATKSTPTAAPGSPRPTFEARTATSKETQTSMKIQQVTSPGGVKAWLVEEHSVPLLALRFVFDGGSSQDPVGKEGLANFLTAMMDEGAGDLDHTKFQERMEDLAFKMSFEDSRDAFYGSFETLSASREPSLDMLRLALTKPRFDAEAVERVKAQLQASLAFAAKSSDKIAARAWSALAFPSHPYGRPTDGTTESLTTITGADLEGFRKRTFARENLNVVAVGDITASELVKVLDHLFGDLPAKADLVEVPKTKPNPAEKLKVIEMDVPQSVVQFGMNGLARKDPDFMTGFVLNHVLGGGGFASRLTEEVREKRGLAYSVYSYLQPYQHVALFGGGVATKNEEVGQSLDVIRAELKRMAEDGVTPTELANAKGYLVGSFALRFDTNAKIANQLLWMLQEDMGIDYVEKRNALVEAVTVEDVKRVAKRLLTVDDLIVTVVGKPKGLTAPRG